MKNIFALSLSIIGGAIGFILGMTITFAMNSNSPVVLIGLGIICAVLGSIGLSKMTPFLDTQDASTQKALTILCAMAAAVLLLFLAVTIVMLKSYYQINA